MGRPFGWLIVADPTDLLDAETDELRAQLNVLRRYEEEHARFDAQRAQHRLAELDAYREAGLWEVRVLAGAASEQELGLIAPVLAGAVDLRDHPYRLRSAESAHDFADALAAKLSDPRDGSAVPLLATAGTLAALTGLPRGEVPGIRVLDAGYFDVTSEISDERSIELGAILDGQDRAGGPVPGAAGHAEPARLRHRRHRGGQVADGPAHPRAAHRGRGQLAGHRAGQVGVRGDGRPDRGPRPGHGDQPGRPGGGAGVGQPAGPRARLPGAGAHRHGPGPVPGRLRRPRAVPADHVAGPRSGPTRTAAGTR